MTQEEAQERAIEALAWCLWLTGDLEDDGETVVIAMPDENRYPDVALMAVAKSKSHKVAVMRGLGFFSEQDARLILAAWDELQFRTDDEKILERLMIHEMELTQYLPAWEHVACALGLCGNHKPVACVAHFLSPVEISLVDAQGGRRALQIPTAHVPATELN